MEPFIQELLNRDGELDVSRIYVYVGFFVLCI